MKHLCWSHEQNKNKMKNIMNQVEKEEKGKKTETENK